MQRLVLLFILILAVSVLPGSAAAPKAGLTRAVLENGLTLLVYENHAAEIVTLEAWAKVGSRDETDELNGAAHFIEHLLHKGTQRRKVGQIFREIESLGGIFNAGTSWDFTYFFISAASRYFDQILDIQADALMHSTFDADEMERERKVVIEELNLRDNTPATRVAELFYGAAYTTHPYRRPIGGTREVLQRMPRQQLVEFYRAHYAPGTVSVVVVGDVATDDVIAKVRRAYGAWRGTAVARPTASPEPAFTGVRRTELELDVRVAYLRLGWLGPSVRDRDFYVMDVLAYALGRGRASRLFRNIRERQRLAQEISAGFPTALDPALVQISAVVEPQDLVRAEQAILAEIAEIRDQGITEDELQRAKALVDGEYVLDNHTSRGLAFSLGYYATIADPELALTYRDQIKQVTRDDVQRVARKYLDPQRYAIAVIRPRGR